MIKIFNANDREFSSNGNIVIEPTKCLEIKKKSLNGWYIEVEVPIRYKEYIEKDKLCVVQTKSKLRPQAFRVAENIEYTSKRIKFKADHVMFDSKDYILVDVRPTNQNGNNALNYINQRTDNVSPFTMFSNVENIDTAYFIRKNLLEAWTIIEERWNGIFDADNWNIDFLQNVGNDNGESIIYGKNLQSVDIYEDWTNVVTKIYPVGYDGVMLPEKFLESDIQYEKPYSKVINFETDIEFEEQTQEKLVEELRENAQKYLNENKFPKISYTIVSNINEKMEIGDTVHLLHPLADIKTEVLEYQYNIISKKIKSLTFGNYAKDVKTKFENIKSSINKITQTLSKQDLVIKTQTNLINNLNKNGYVYIDDNEIMILDKLPKEQAKNVWRFGLGGIGFSSNGYEGPFETAITMDGQINAKFITTGTMSVSRIEGLADELEGIQSVIELNNENITTSVEKVQDALEQEKTERVQSENSIIETVSQTYSTKTETNQAKDEAISSANASTDNKLQDYSTTTQMNSAIEQKANLINVELNKKINGEDITGAFLMLLINGDTSEAKLSADKIDIDGKAVHFKTNINQTIGPFTENDYNKVRNYIMEVGTLTNEELKKYDITGDGKVNSLDIAYIRRAIMNGGQLTFSGTYEINPYSKDRSIALYDSRLQKYSTIISLIHNYFDTLYVDYLNVKDFSTQGQYGYVSAGDDTDNKTFSFYIDGILRTSQGYVQSVETLYDNSSGTTGTVALSDSAVNYSYLKIFYKDVNDSSRNGCASVEVSDPNGKNVVLTIYAPAKAESNVIRWVSKTMAISGTNITNVDYLAGYITNSNFGYWGNSEIKIYKVLGYK